MVILKPLSDALRDGDTIRAVIRSSGSNQDGKTAGITNPSKEAQVNVIRETYEEGGLDLRITRFLEAHGTGTVIGDSVEAAAIAEVFKDKRSRDGPLYVGRSNLTLGT